MLSPRIQVSWGTRSSQCTFTFLMAWYEMTRLADYHRPREGVRKRKCGKIKLNHSLFICSASCWHQTAPFCFRHCSLMDPLWFTFVCLLYLFVFVCYFQGSRHLRRRGEADCFSSWRGAESRQAHLRQTPEDPVSVWNKAGLTQLKTRSTNSPIETIKPILFAT